MKHLKEDIASQVEKVDLEKEARRARKQGRLGFYCCREGRGGHGWGWGLK